VYNTLYKDDDDDDDDDDDIMITHACKSENIKFTNYVQYFPDSKRP